MSGGTLTTKRETRAVLKSEARRLFLKAEEFLAGASASRAASRWNAAGLDAIHAGIAAADAALIALVGHRSASSALDSSHAAPSEGNGSTPGEFSTPFAESARLCKNMVSDLQSI
jgi:hypothetical protein